MSTIILLRGRPGVGKTTISNALSARLKLPVIRKDDLYDSIAGYIDQHESRNQACYSMLYRILGTNAQSGSGFILDFPFNRNEHMRSFQTWLFENGFRMKPVLCVCEDEQLWAERFNRRSAQPLPNQLITDFAELKRYYGDLTIQPVEGERTVNTARELDSIVADIAAFIEAGQDGAKKQECDPRR